MEPTRRRDVQLTGWAQINRDSSNAVTSRLPAVLSIMAAVTLVLLFLLTGSVALPLKALVMNVLSLTAAFGALVWVFQDGHLAAFGTTATGTLVASVPVLLFCLASGTDWHRTRITQSTVTKMTVHGLVERDDVGRLQLTPAGRTVFDALLHRL